jgi:hypothetical protein
MAPALLVEFGSKTPWRSRRRFIVARVALRTRRAGAATGACVLAFPGSIGMILADPAAILADYALHVVPCLLARRASSSQSKCGLTSAPLWPQA